MPSLTASAKDFGKSLKRLREARGWSHAVLSRALYDHGYQIEAGGLLKIEQEKTAKADAYLAFAAAVVFAVPMNEILGLEKPIAAAEPTPLDPLYNRFIEARRKYGDVALMAQFQRLDEADAALKAPVAEPGNADATSPRKRKTGRVA